MACSPQNIDHKAIEIALDQYMDSIKQEIKTFKRRKVPATTVGQYALNNRVAVDADTATDVLPGTTDRCADMAYENVKYGAAQKIRPIKRRMKPPRKAKKVKVSSKDVKAWIQLYIQECEKCESMYSIMHQELTRICRRRIM